VPQSDSTPPPTPTETRAFWYPRVRGGITVIVGTLAYVALAAAFGNTPSFATAFVGMVGSIVMMSWVWYLESRRAAKHHGPTSVPRDR
jgi:hypothetical protein